MQMEVEESIRDLVEVWARVQHVVVLTGAGLSTASGIPDFRSPGGLWERFRAVSIQEFLESESARVGYWRYKQVTWEILQQAEPNPAHTSLTDLAKGGRIELLVTQNVDGLHSRSGFPVERMVRIHGTDAEVVCLSCGNRQAREETQTLWEQSQTPPRCSCGGWWKPATISFGQSLVRKDLERSFAAAAAADLLVAVGSSLVVSPINGMVPLARDAGATTAILTASDTPFDGKTDIRIRHPVEEVLPAIRDRVLANRAGA